MTGNLPSNASASPCSGAQKAAAHHCAEAERLAEAARAADEDLRVARRQRGELLREFDTDARLGDRRALTDAKLEAAAAYRTQYEHARDGGAVMVAAATWINDISRMNRASRRAAREAATLARQQVEMDAIVERVHLTAEAARIAADAARQACLDARRTLAACEEARDALKRPLAASQSTAGGVVPMAELERAPRAAARAEAGGEPAVVALLRGDRQMLQTVVSRLAEEIGEDAGRLQLLMLDLRDAIISGGRSACVFSFPPRHPFWGQFNQGEARAVAAALATLGRRFDGQDGWSGGQVAHPREVAMAISLAGRDPRSIRRPPTPVELETLWQGTSVAAAEFLFTNAPDLRLDALIGLLGPRADALAELWDRWGRLRPMLLGSDAALT